MVSGRQVDPGDAERAHVPPGTKPAIKPKNVRDQLDRVLSDPLFRNSKRYSSMLKFIVDRTLDGEEESLKERIIGIEVFGRTADFDASLDSTVRVVATEVRRRLVQYYNEPAHEHELRIDLPTRSYIAEFKYPEESQEQQAVRRWQKLSRHRYLWLSIAAAILLFAFWGVHRLVTPAPPINRFWAPMLNSPEPVLIVMKTPLSENSQPVQSVSPSNSKESLREFLIQQRGLTGSYDLTAATIMSSFLARRGKECIIPYGKATTLEDFKEHPVLLLGGPANDWTLRLEANLRFQFKKDSTNQLYWIEDSSNPANRDWLADMSVPYDQDRTEYALITRAFNHSTGHWWVSVAGLTGIGTLGAQQMLTNPIAVATLSNRLPKEWDRKNLQVVLAINMIKGSPGNAQFVTAYSW